MTDGVFLGEGRRRVVLAHVWFPFGLSCHMQDALSRRVTFVVAFFVVEKRAKNAKWRSVCLWMDVLDVLMW